MVDGYMTHERNRYRDEWERCRWQTSILVNFSGNTKRKVKPTDLITFEWDKVSKEDIKVLNTPEMKARLDELFPKHLN